MSLDDPSPKIDLLAHPDVSLMGEVGDSMVRSFVEQMRQVEAAEGAVVVELTTMGGDAEFGRRLALEADIARRRLGQRPLLFLGKTVVYSAGVTFMSGFPREHRFLTRDAEMLIHVRQLQKSIEIQGPMRASLPQLKSLVAQVESGLELERRDFVRLIEGSDVTMDELCERALYNWYLSAEEALARGLIAGIV